MAEKIIVKIDQDLEEIIPSFLENRRKDLIQLDAALADNLLQEIEMVAHKLAGNAGSYGFDDLGDIGRQLESACKENNNTQVKLLCAKYKDYLERIEVVYE